ncbi:MAG: AzlD domain-containing protein [Eubacteriales bacterium]|jgi:branched-subunit amino acid transport protein|nr:AzlD domain-containing protein [Bacillota bacterium]MBV1728591.1 AzlD domain-containing protein [Desulforudis sp.]MDZ4042661.1 AzlD domain-containing protein [Eubacteriales bacterium]MBU4533710.1 AzlD domain-containing protein [Bacillota bacterium]MBU4553607.1 AzlD domain-containing protein [Bacillota bacterium]
MRVEIVLIILGMAVATFFTRFACLALFNHNGVPAWLEKWLKHVPTAILASLIAPALLLPAGSLDISTDNHYLLAGCVTAATAYKTRSVIATIGLGLAVMFTLRWYGG